MKTKRYVVGRLAIPGERVSALWSTEIGPHSFVDVGSKTVTRAVFRSFNAEGQPSGVLANERFALKGDKLVECRAGVNWAGPYGASVARETDDPDLVTRIDAAAKRVDDAREELRAAIRAEREELEVIVPRMRPARVCSISTERERAMRETYLAKLAAKRASKL